MPSYQDYFEQAREALAHLNEADVHQLYCTAIGNVPVDVQDDNFTWEEDLNNTRSILRDAFRRQFSEDHRDSPLQLNEAIPQYDPGLRSEPLIQRDQGTHPIEEDEAEPELAPADQHPPHPEQEESPSGRPGEHVEQTPAAWPPEPPGEDSEANPSPLVPQVHEDDAIIPLDSAAATQEPSGQEMEIDVLHPSAQVEPNGDKDHQGSFGALPHPHPQPRADPMDMEQSFLGGGVLPATSTFSGPKSPVRPADEFLQLAEGGDVPLGTHQEGSVHDSDDGEHGLATDTAGLNHDDVEYMSGISDHHNESDVDMQEVVNNDDLVEIPASQLETSANDQLPHNSSGSMSTQSLNTHGKERQLTLPQPDSSSLPISPKPKNAPYPTPLPRGTAAPAAPKEKPKPVPPPRPALAAQQGEPSHPQREKGQSPSHAGSAPGSGSVSVKSGKAVHQETGGTGSANAEDGNLVDEPSAPLNQPPNKATKHAADLVKSTHAFNNKNNPQADFEIDGQDLPVRSEGNIELVPIISKIVEDAISNIKSILELPIGAKEPSIDVVASMLGDAPVADPFEGKAFDENTDSIKAFYSTKSHRRLSENYMMSFFTDIIQREVERQSQPGMTPAAVRKAVKKRFLQQTGFGNLKPATQNQNLRKFEVMGEMRKEGCQFLIAHMNNTLANHISRSEVTATDLLPWDQVLSPIIQRVAREMRNQLNGDFRGRAHIPQRLQSQSLLYKWNNIMGRWADPAQLRKFYESFGAPSPSNNLLATETCLEQGFQGHSDLNGSGYIALAQSDNEWVAVTIASVPKGTFLGVCPHITAMASKKAPDKSSSHIYARIANVSYDPLPVLGVLSFVEYVANVGDANARFASDLYCDLVAPNYYSCRVVVVATKDIHCLDTIRVQISDASHLNASIQREAVDPSRVMVPTTDDALYLHHAQGLNLGDAFAVPFEDFGQIVCYQAGKVQSELARTYWNQNLALPYWATIAVRPDHFVSLQRVRKLNGAPVLAADEEWAKPFDPAYNVWEDNLSDIGTAQFALLALKATHLPTQETAKTKVSKSIRDALARPSRPSGTATSASLVPLAPKDIAIPPNSRCGHLNAALQLLATMYPIRDIFDQRWQWLFVSESWTPESWGGCEMNEENKEHARKVVGDVLDGFSVVLRYLSDKEEEGMISGALDDLLVNIEQYGLVKYPTNKNTSLHETQDPHDIIMMLYNLILESIKEESVWSSSLKEASAAKSKYLTRTSQTEELRTCSFTAYASFKERHLGSWMVEDSTGLFGQVYERFHCTSEQCDAILPVAEGCFPPMNQLLVDLPGESGMEIDLLTAIRDSCGMGSSSSRTRSSDLKGCTRCGNREAILVHLISLVRLPKWMIVRFNREGLSRNFGQTLLVRNNTGVQLPSDLKADLSPICATQIGTQSKNTTYDIVASIEHESQSYQDGNYTCLALRSGSWVQFDRSNSKVVSADAVRGRPQNIYMLLLRLQGSHDT